MTYREWCEAHNCQHAHCPHDCFHPQPFVDGERLFCGRCLYEYDTVTEMVPCTPETCGD